VAGSKGGLDDANNHIKNKNVILEDIHFFVSSESRQVVERLITLLDLSRTTTLFVSQE